MTHSGQVNVPRQCDGLAGKTIPAIHQLCEIRQLLGGADVIVRGSTITIPSGDKIRLRTVVKGHVALIGQGIFQRGSILRQCWGLIFSLGHQHIIQSRFDVNRLTVVAICGQLQRDRFGICIDGVGGIQLFGYAIFLNAYDDLDLVCLVGVILLHSYCALSHRNTGILALLRGDVSRRCHRRALGVPAGVDISRVRVALDDGRAAAVYHFRGKGRGGRQRQREHHAHQQAHDAPGHVACPFLHVICSSLC